MSRLKLMADEMTLLLSTNSRRLSYQSGRYLLIIVVFISVIFFAVRFNPSGRRLKTIDSAQTISLNDVDGLKTHWFLPLPDPQVITRPKPRYSTLPESFDWRNVTNISLVTPIGNQNYPKACGSCWAFASTRSLSDRLKIALYKKTNQLPRDIILSPQELLDCGISFGTCHGGDPRYAYKWIYENGITEEIYVPYIAQENIEQCHCHRSLIRYTRPPKRYYIDEYGTFYPNPNIVKEMMEQIYAYGPIVTAMFSFTEEFHNYHGGYILNSTTVYNRTTHDVSIVGWGKEHGIPYWICRNSYGTDWGEQGFFRIERGKNTYNIELQGAWAVPKI